MTFFSWRFTLIKSPTITVAFVFFFVRWHSSHRIDQNLCPNVLMFFMSRREWTFWCTAPTLQALRIRRDRHTSSNGTAVRNFSALWVKQTVTEIVIPLLLVYASGTQFFSSILKCPRYEIFRDCEKNNFSQKSLYSSVRHVDLKFTTHFLSTYGRVP